MLCIPIVKIDEKRRLVYGRATDETPDLQGEVMDYESSKPHFLTWSAEQAEATGGLSLGNLRSMHSQVASGIIKDLQLDDHAKAVDIVARVVDDNEWEKTLAGVYAGFSLGGRYLRRWQDVVGERMVTRYTAAPTEISLVDKPANQNARFYEILKRDGSTQRVAFQHEGISMFIPKDDNFCGRSTAAALIKAALSAPSGDLTEALGKRARPAARQEHLMQGVSKRLEKQLAAAGMSIKGPHTSARNGATESSVDAIRAIHSQGARKMAPTGLPPQSDNYVRPPTATRADATAEHPECRTPAYSPPPLFGATPHEASEHDNQRTPPGNSDQYGMGKALDEIRRIHRAGPTRMWGN